MITGAVLLVFLGLVVFGPKKTIEIAQTIGQALAQVKNATGQFQSQIEEVVRTQHKADAEPMEAQVDRFGL
ncbi:MAG TPA: twin-arginine translocase TatA/TatE family subunit [Terriglobales bacterium]|nr:twin-arginine translocase TatA/TatE family subunit [Terriglobales bacterium]